MRKEFELKTNDQIRKMRVAGLLTQKALANVKAAIKPGVTTSNLIKLLRKPFVMAEAFQIFSSLPATTTPFVHR